jgi:hypothetical protein
MVATKRTAGTRQTEVANKPDATREIVDWFDQFLNHNNPHQMANNVLDAKSDWAKVLEDSRSQHDVMTQFRYVAPDGIEAMVCDHVVQRHFMRERSKAGFGENDSPVRKFVQSPRNILVARGVVSVSMKVPDFMPEQAGLGEQLRVGVGQALIRAANFVFKENFTMSEMTWFREFLRAFSDSRKLGNIHVREITYLPFWSLYRASVFHDMVRDLTGLKKITLGISLPNALEEQDASDESPSRFMSYADFETKTNLDFFYGTMIKEMVLVSAPMSEFLSRAEKDTMKHQGGEWLIGLRNHLRAGFANAKKGSVQVSVDLDDQWDKVGMSMVVD